MKFTRIDDKSIRADNASETGAVYYYRWHDEGGDQYVQMDFTKSGVGVGEGTHSSDLYRYIDINGEKYPVGFNPDNGAEYRTKNNNTRGHLKAVKLDIIRRELLSQSDNQE